MDDQLTRVLGRWKGYSVGTTQRFEAGVKGPAAQVWIELHPRPDRVKVCDGCGEPFSEDHAMRWWGSLLSSGFRLQTYRRDSEFIYRFRQLLAHEITHISQRPYVLVDVEPDQAMLMTSRTLHVRGVAEAGTRIHLNGRQVGIFSADQPYVFWDEVPLKPGDNTIAIQAVAADGSQKTLYREVRVTTED